MPTLTKLGLTVEVLSLVAFLTIILIYNRFRAGVSSRKTLGKSSFRKQENTGSRRTTHSRSQDCSRISRDLSSNQVLGKYRKHTLKKTSTFTNKQRTWQEFREALRRLSD